jgi:hypothetical protein
MKRRFLQQAFGGSHIFHNGLVFGRLNAQLLDILVLVADRGGEGLMLRL